MLYVNKTSKMGKGLFTDKPIKRGQFILRCHGDKIKGQEMWRLRQYKYSMQIGKELWLASNGGHLDDYINHSCKPNIGFSKGSLSFYALRKIKKGEELFWDYSTCMMHPGWSLKCLCGQSKCRKTIKSFPKLKKKDQRRLKRLCLNYLR